MILRFISSFGYRAVDLQNTNRWIVAWYMEHLAPALVSLHASSTSMFRTVFLLREALESHKIGSRPKQRQEILTSLQENLVRTPGSRSWNFMIWTTK